MVDAANFFFYSTFADKHLGKFSSDLLNQYDQLINEPSNEWDLYYWITGKEVVPPEYNSVVMKMLQKHSTNENKETRYSQPELRHQKKACS